MIFMEIEGDDDYMGGKHEKHNTLSLFIHF